MDTKMREEAQTSIRRWVITSFWMVIFIGLPFWWKTTEVYRAPLPHADIEKWVSGKACHLQFPINITLHIAPSEESTPSAKDIEFNVKKELFGRFNDQSDSKDALLFLTYVEGTEWNPGNNLDATITSVLEAPPESLNGHYHIFVASQSLFENKNKHGVFVGKKRSVLIIAKVYETAEISKTITTLILRLFSKSHSKIRQIVSENSNRGNQLESMRTLKYSPTYQITFSLLNGDPMSIMVDWDMDEAVKRYLNPFLNEIKFVSNFTVDSQIQHYATLTMKPKSHISENVTYYYLSPDSLPHFINSAEWSLASAVSSSPSINFILYVPSANESPLRIHNSKDEPIESNAFLIPRWGGVVISNSSIIPSLSSHHFSAAELQPIMEIFISQLRGLLGVTNLQNEVGKGVYFTPALIRGITTLELDALVRQRAAENVIDAVGTISSLAKLVEEIPNMVVLDHIQIEILQALSSLEQSCTALSKGFYELALEHSIRAIVRAESAFFDPTMVSMLYFPDEHKYAIYMPLFLPISMPLVMVVVKEIRASRERKAKAKVE